MDDNFCFRIKGVVSAIETILPHDTLRVRNIHSNGQRRIWNGDSLVLVIDPDDHTIDISDRNGAIFSGLIGVRPASEWRKSI